MRSARGGSGYSRILRSPEYRPPCVALLRVVPGNPACTCTILTCLMSWRARATMPIRLFPKAHDMVLCVLRAQAGPFSVTGMHLGADGKYQEYTMLYDRGKTDATRTGASGRFSSLRPPSVTGKRANQVEAQPVRLHIALSRSISARGLANVPDPGPWAGPFLKEGTFHAFPVLSHTPISSIGAAGVRDRRTNPLAFPQKCSHGR